jgi:hypothetical protein
VDFWVSAVLLLTHPPARREKWHRRNKRIAPDTARIKPTDNLTGRQFLHQDSGEEVLTAASTHRFDFQLRGPNLCEAANTIVMIAATSTAAIKNQNLFSSRSSLSTAGDYSA